VSTLNVENLQKIIQTGDTEALFSNGMSAGPASELRVTNEMKANGMQMPGAAGVEGTGGTFSGMLRDSLEKVNEMQQQADTSIKELVAGRSKNIHETMLTIERADTSLKLMMQVRNKILDAYREIMRMQV
jgi:flagellar hook-basal body complex protein FliE